MQSSCDLFLERQWLQQSHKLFFMFLCLYWPIFGRLGPALAALWASRLFRCTRKPGTSTSCYPLVSLTLCSSSCSLTCSLLLSCHLFSDLSFLFFFRRAVCPLLVSCCLSPFLSSNLSACICTGWRLPTGWFSLPCYRVPRGHLS